MKISGLLWLLTITCSAQTKKLLKLVREEEMKESIYVEAKLSTEQQTNQKQISQNFNLQKERVQSKQTDETISCGVRLVTESRIVGGSQSSPGRWPWQALLAHLGRAICGGALINQRWALTAAHCVATDDNARNYFVRLGAFNYAISESTAEDYSISKIFMHNEYDPDVYINDIALLQMNTEVQFTNYILPVCLPGQNEAVPDGKTCWASGWGQTNNLNEPRNILREAEMPIVNRYKCSDAYKEINKNIDEGHICAGYLEAGIGVCSGDSGGPLVCQNTSSSPFVLQGLTSFGISACAVANFPDVYARVSNYIDWTENIINNPNNNNDKTFFEIPAKQSGSIITDDETFRLPVNNFTKLYEPNMMLEWILRPNFGSNNKVKIDISFIKRISIESTTGGICFDAVTIQKKPDFSFFLCGFRFPSNISLEVKPGEDVIIRFQSDDSIEYQGFALDVNFEFLTNTTTTQPAATTEANTALCGRRLVPQSRIVGGEEASPGKWPWQALVLFNFQPVCGGTLINDRWVLTAAHCVETGVLNNYTVVLGAFNYEISDATSVAFTLSRITSHENYNSNKFSNDIALLELRTRVQFNDYIVPACLPEQDDIVPTGKSCWITGWGKTENILIPQNILREAQVPIMSNDVCSNAFENSSVDINIGHVCAGYLQAGIGICNGDGGGPLVCQDSLSLSFVVQGITSFYGTSCGGNVPDVFTRVGHYVCWIEAIMNNTSTDRCNSAIRTQCLSYVTYFLFAFALQVLLF